MAVWKVQNWFHMPLYPCPYKCELLVWKWLIDPPPPHTHTRVRADYKLQIHWTVTATKTGCKLKTAHILSPWMVIIEATQCLAHHHALCYWIAVGMDINLCLVSFILCLYWTCKLINTWKLHHQYIWLWNVVCHPETVIWAYFNNYLND